MVGKMAGFLAIVAVLALPQIAAAAGAGESSFLNADSALAPGSLVETRGGVGVSAEGETEEERRRRAAHPGGSLSGVTAPLPRNRSLPATRAASRATDIDVSPAFVNAVRNELAGIGLK